MGYRKFVDRNGYTWQVVPRSRSEWEFDPVDNPGPPRAAAAPGYEKDPFELSKEELQRLLDSSQAPPSRPKKSPFVD